MAGVSTEVIFHPVRMRILTVLSGQNLTTQQIGAALPDVAQATLYRHLKTLMKAEIVAVIEQRPVRGVLERVYALAGGNVSAALDFSQMTQDDWRQAFAAYTAALMGQFEVYVRQDQAAPAADAVTFRTAPLLLNDEEAVQLIQDLRAVIASVQSHTAEPGRRRRLLSTVLMPEAELM